MSQMLSGDTSAAGCLRTPGEALRQFVRLVDHVKPRLDTIDIPALIVHPRDDDMASVSNAIYLQRKLGGIVDCVILNDSYHMVTIDQQRDVVVEKTLGFAAWLAGHVGDRARKPGRRPQLDHDSVSAGTVAGVA